jgi:hypothetical protein
MAPMESAGNGGNSVIGIAGGSAITAAGGSKAVEKGTGSQAPGTGGAKGTAGAAGKSRTAESGAGGKAASKAGAGGAAGAAGRSVTTHHTEDLGEGDGQDVVTIGDSWMNIATNGGGIEGGLDRVASNRYRHYALAGTMVLTEAIPQQYETAKAMGAIKTVIMTGGGNDVIMDLTLTADCQASGERCKQRVIDTANRLGKLWAEMSADGVRDVFYINYSEGAGTGVGDIDGTSIYREVVRTIPPPLVYHPIQTTDIVNGRLVDGIHPTLQACTEVAQAVFDHMVEAGARR